MFEEVITDTPGKQSIGMLPGLFAISHPNCLSTSEPEAAIRNCQEVTVVEGIVRETDERLVAAAVVPT